MKTILLVDDFHEAFEIERPKKPGWPKGTTAQHKKLLLELAEYQREVAKTAHQMAKDNGKATVLLRVQLMAEELAEIIEAMAGNDLSAVLHEMADLRYVADGSALAFGLGMVLEPAVEEIHRANMSKLEDGKPVKDAAGRVIKGKAFQKADVKPLLTKR